MVMNKKETEIGAEMLSTKDNPFNPFNDFDRWYSWDVANGYNSCSFLARVARPSYSDVNETDNDLIIHEAISDIIAYDVTGMYIRVIA